MQSNDMSATTVVMVACFVKNASLFDVAKHFFAISRNNDYFCTIIH